MPRDDFPKVDSKTLEAVQAAIGTMPTIDDKTLAIVRDAARAFDATNTKQISAAAKV